MLADGMEDFVRYEVSIEDAYGLQTVLTRTESPITGREEYLFNLGFGFSRLGDLDRSLQCYDQSKALSPANPAPWFNRGLVLIHLGRIEDAKTSYAHAKVLFEKNGDKLGMAATLFQMGTIEQNRDPSEAVKLFNESLRISQSTNDKMQEAFCIHHLGMIEQARKHYGEARRLYNQSLRIKQELGDRSVMAVTLANLAQIELNEWDSDRKRTHLDAAEGLYKESLGILYKSRDAVGIANVLHQMYKVEYWKGNYLLAKKFYDQSEAVKRELQDRQARIKK